MTSLIESGKLNNQTELKQKHQEANKKAINAFGDDVRCDAQKRQIIHLLKCHKIDQFTENNFNKFEKMYQLAQVGEQHLFQICPLLCGWIYQTESFRAIILLILDFFH